MNTLTLQATFCGLLHGLGKLAFRADKTAADLLAALPDTPEWAVVRGGAAAGSDAARCAAFARSLSVTADTPAAEPVSSRYRPLRSIFSHLNGEHPGYSVPAARPDGALHDPVQDAPDIPAAVYRELYQELTGQLTGLAVQPSAGKRAAGPAGIPVQRPACQHRAGRGPGYFSLRPAQADGGSGGLRQRVPAAGRRLFPAGHSRRAAPGTGVPALHRRLFPHPAVHLHRPYRGCPAVPPQPVRSFWNCSWSTTWTSCWTAAA